MSVHDWIREGRKEKSCQRRHIELQGYIWDRNTLLENLLKYFQCGGQQRVCGVNTFMWLM